MSPRYDVFLSHATADKPAVEYLAHKLRAVGIEPFLDKWHLIPGDPWQEALEEALDESRTCAVFLGPKGIGGWQNEEMRSALESRVRNKAFRVIPVLLPNSFEPRKEELPRFLRRLTWVDFRAGLDDEEAFRRLVSGIRGIAPGPGGGGGGGPVKPPRPYPYRSMAQAPEEFVPRSEYEKVLEALCPKEGAVQSGMSVGITTALRGAGGFGKTALAQQICQDERVRETYPDGILWTTMGEEIDANGRLSQVRDLIRWWTDREAPAFESVTAASAKLRELLASSRVLIVIDDVWNSADITPFQGIGDGSALLITTRDSQSLPEDSKRIEVDAMASAEAVALLRSGLQDAKEQELISLAARLGEWPLLLKIVNRQLYELVQGEGQSIQNALWEINEALNLEGFKAFDRDDPESRHAAASRTILVSVQRLQEKERELYFKLAVFPEDIQIPFSLLERFWKLGGFQIRKFCRRLHDLSLLLEFNAKSETVRIHDIVRQVLIEQMGNELPSLHRHLLDAFRPASGFWFDLPVGEKYLWRNLAGHLLGAERKDELKLLVTDLSFLQAKLNATDVNDLMADYQAFVGQERELRLVRDALQLSAHVLTRNRQQLAVQLFGRLIGFSGDNIKHLIDDAGALLKLRLRKGSLTPPGGALLRIDEGLSRRITAVTLLEGGRQAICGFSNGMLEIWDVKAGKALRTFAGHSGAVSSVALLLDGYRAISGSYDGTLRVWNINTGRLLHAFLGNSGWVTKVLALDSRRAIFGSFSGIIRMCNFETGDIIRTFTGHSGGITDLSMLGSRQIISSSSDGTLRMWNLETGEILRILTGHSAAISSVSTVGGRRAISGSYDGTLRVWDLRTGETLHILSGHPDRVTTVSVLGGSRAICGYYSGMLRIWDLETGKNLRTILGYSDIVTAISIPDNSRIVTGSSEGTLRVWDIKNSEPSRTPSGHSDSIATFSVLGDNQVVSSSYDGFLRIWDLVTGEPLGTIRSRPGEFNSIKPLDHYRIISKSSDGNLKLWDLETRREIHNFEGTKYLALAILDSQKILAYAYNAKVYSGTLRVLDARTGKPIAIFRNNIRDVRSLEILDDRRIVVGDGNTLQVLDVDTGKTLSTFQVPYFSELAVLDSRRIVASSHGRDYVILDMETGKALYTSRELKRIRAVALLDGHSFVVCTLEGALEVWDLEKGVQLFDVTLDYPVSVVTVARDKRVVIAGDRAGDVHFLDWVHPEQNF